MKTLYLFVNIGTVIIPLIFSFHPRIKFHKTWKAFFPATILVAALFIGWDILFTNRDVWNFNSRYILGYSIMNLPVEEILFFICIPFACIFTYHSLDKFFDLSWNRRTENLVCIVIATILLITGILFYERLYTSVTFIATGIVCLSLKYIFHIDYFGKSLTVYSVLLIPFFIVNGILTGTGPEEAVVIYNNAENLGIRLLTIPVEDMVYGFLLVLLNLFFFQLLKLKFKLYEYRVN